MSKKKKGKGIVDDPKCLAEAVRSGKILAIKRPPWGCMHCMDKTVTMFEYVPNYMDRGEDVLIAKCERCGEEVLACLPPIAKKIKKIALKKHPLLSRDPI